MRAARIVLKGCKALLTPGPDWEFLEIDSSVDVELADAEILWSKYADAVLERGEAECPSCVVMPALFDALAFDPGARASYSACRGVLGYNATSDDRRRVRTHALSTHAPEGCLADYAFVRSVNNLGDDELKQIAETSGGRLFVWVSATLEEVYEHKRRYGTFPVERLYRLDLLCERTVLAGLGWATSWELEYVRGVGARAVFTPSFHLLNATGGVIPVRELGGLVALGTGLGEVPVLDMLGEVKNLLYMVRWSMKDKLFGYVDALSTASIAGWRNFVGTGCNISERLPFVVVELPRRLAEGDPLEAMIANPELVDYVLAGFARLR